MCKAIQVQAYLFYCRSANKRWYVLASNYSVVWYKTDNNKKHDVTQCRRLSRRSFSLRICVLFHTHCDRTNWEYLILYMRGSVEKKTMYRKFEQPWYIQMSCFEVCTLYRCKTYDWIVRQLINFWFGLIFNCLNSFWIVWEKTIS